MNAQVAVAPDGSPVDVYRALPVEPEFRPVLESVKPPASVLDLGCGVGRLANDLVQRGFTVTGVDESRSMLKHLNPDVEAIESRIDQLRLDRRFDIVVLASHFVNIADPAEAQSFLTAIADHVLPGGAVFVEHYDRMLSDTAAKVGEVHVEFRVLEVRGNEFDGRVTYALDDRFWPQAFTARLLDDEALRAALTEAGLRFRSRLSSSWLVAEPDLAGATNG